jgi:hypothetical protein
VDVDTTKWRVTQAMLELEIAKVKNAKVEHSSEKPGLALGEGMVDPHADGDPPNCQLKGNKMPCKIDSIVN